MKVADVMTTPVRSLAPAATLEEALRLIGSERIRHVPVVEAGRVVGVVSDRDLLTATGGEPAGARGRVVGDVMHSEVFTAAPEDSLVKASLEVIVRRLGCLPVVGDDGLVGILTETDLLRVFLRAGRAGRLSGSQDPRVEKLQSRSPRTIRPDALLETALTVARMEGFRHLPVVDAGGALVGMLSDRDLCRELGTRASLGRPVSEAMSREVVTIDIGERATRAAELFLDNHFSGLPVLHGGELEGVLTIHDLLEHCPRTVWEN